MTAVLGHTRNKTRGSEHKSFNNHPISAGLLLGAHNANVTANRGTRRRKFVLKTNPGSFKMWPRLVGFVYMVGDENEAMVEGPPGYDFRQDLKLNETRYTRRS